MTEETVEISKNLYDRLNYLGLLPNEVRNHNVGESDYSQYTIQSWSVWLDWELNPWDADIVKRIQRKKSTDPRKKDYKKIIHICQERIRQIDAEERIKQYRNYEKKTHIHQRSYHRGTTRKVHEEVRRGRENTKGARLRRNKSHKGVGV